jgi:hypothetical protein
LVDAREILHLAVTTLVDDDTQEGFQIIQRK